MAKKPAFGGGPKDLSKLPPALANYWRKKRGEKPVDNEGTKSEPKSGTKTKSPAKPQKKTAKAPVKPKATKRPPAKKKATSKAADSHKQTFGRALKKIGTDLKKAQKRGATTRKEIEGGSNIHVVNSAINQRKH